MMRFFLSLIVLIILLVSAASPIISSEDIETSDSTVAALEFDVSYHLADPECPPGGNGTGGGC